MALAPRLPALRWVAAAALLVLAVVFADQAAGALRDGAVSRAGIVAGGLMSLQLLTLTASLLLATPSTGPMPRWDTRHLLAIVLVVALTLVGVRVVRDVPASAEAAAERWLAALAGAEEDGGWALLDEFTAELYPGGRDRYVADAAAARWDFAWSIGLAHPVEAGFWHVRVDVPGGSEPLPEFMSQRLVHTICLDGVDVGFGIYVETGLLRAPSVSPGARAGGPVGGCEASEPLPEGLEPGTEQTWTGHELEIWNWTELPVFAVNQDGARAEIGPCGRIGTDDFGGQVTLRAAGGYIGTIFWEPIRGVTTFAVLLPDDIYLNGAPPAEPMPPCRGEPWVQPGE